MKIQKHIVLNDIRMISESTHLRTYFRPISESTQYYSGYFDFLIRCLLEEEEEVINDSLPATL
jgi:hypothetical protein